MKKINSFHNIFIVILLLLLFNNIKSKKQLNFLSFKEEIKPSKGYTDLINYITSNGGYVNPKLVPNEISDSNRYIITTDKIKKDEVLLFSPDIILISKVHKYVYKKCQEAYGFEEEYDYDCIVYFMTIDKYNSTTMFKPYYNYLPTLDKSEFVFSFSEEEKELFKETGVTDGIWTYEYFLNKALKPVEDRLKSFAEKHKIKYETLLEEFKNNFSLVGTRNFGRPDCYYDLSTMVPFLDLLNHSDKNNTHWYYDERKGGYILIAIRDIDKNEEITDSYGKYYNSLLYKTYGFVIPGNIYPDSVPTKINGESYTLTIEFLKDHVERMYEKLLKSKNVDFNEAKNIILKDLNDKKNYYLGLKTNRFSMNVIIKEHLEILNAYIKEVENFDINRIN
jgi:hypothetical protein